MARSRWKLIYFSKKIWRLIFRLKKKKFKHRVVVPFQIRSRHSSIPLCLNGWNVNIHKGNNSRLLFVDLHHTCYKFGEYAFTRKLYHYPLRKKKRR